MIETNDQLAKKLLDYTAVNSELAKKLTVLSTDSLTRHSVGRAQKNNVRLTAARAVPAQRRGRVHGKRLPPQRETTSPRNRSCHDPTCAATSVIGTMRQRRGEVSTGYGENLHIDVKVGRKARRSTFATALSRRGFSSCCSARRSAAESVVPAARQAQTPRGKARVCSGNREEPIRALQGRDTIHILT